jgi:hypothetical protein
MPHERFHEAAQRVLDGDESIQAASDLEGVVLGDYPGDVRFEDLAYVLSLYSPGHESPYTGVEEVRAAILRTLAIVR